MVKGLRRTSQPVEVLPFRGYGTPTRLSVSGRLLECRGIVHREEAEHEGALFNFRTFLRRLMTHPIRNAEVLLSLGRTRVEARTDDDGYFRALLEPGEALEPGWHDVEVEVTSSTAGGEGAHATAQALVPPDDAEFGVISDIDDTVVKSSVTERLKMIRIVLFQSARTRIPFPGVAAFYRALKLGPDGRSANPIFYVSRSPWNLYDLFETFFQLHDLPRGPLFLRDLHWFEAPSKALGTGQDKLTRIRNLFRLYPSLRWVLVGDSGQKDPEIYRQMALEHPGRVRAIYIRDVTSKSRSERVRVMAQELAAHGVPVILAKETLEAARHAVEANLISAEWLAEIEGRKREDEEVELPAVTHRPPEPPSHPEP